MKGNFVHLVAYFSPGWETRYIARNLARGVDADLMRIVPKKPYTDRDLDRGRFFSRCSREHRWRILPEIETPEYELEQYSVIFLGFPIWYDRAPNIIKSFLRLVKRTDQKLVLFATSERESIANAVGDLQHFVGKDQIIAARLFESDADMQEIGDWGKSVLQDLYGERRTGVEAYLSAHYTGPYVPEKEEESGDDGASTVHFSRAVSGVKFSLDLSEEYDKRREEERKRNQVLLDRYNRLGIRTTMQNMPARSGSGAVLKALDNYTDQSFVGKLLQLIREKGMSEPAVYRAAQIDRKLFSKIISNQEYKPAKDTCVALAYALRLDLQEANDLLSRAGYTFSHSSKRDVILEYFFTVGNYNIYEINEVLFHLLQKPLGRMA